MIINTNLKIAASVVLYNPDINRLKQNILSISTQVNKVYLVDNCSSNSIEIYKLIKKLNINAVFIKNQQNYGIAKALNQAFEMAYRDGFEWLITMDQDSILPNDGIELLKKNCKKSVGIVCPQINDLNENKIKIVEKKSEIIKKCITSGSLTQINAWIAVGGFDETMFIDGVDFDFCKRIIDKEFIIILDRRVILTHEIGHVTAHRLLFWTVKTQNHSAFRKYYIARNIIYYDRKIRYIGYPVISILRVTKQVLSVLFLEKEKTRKIKAMIRGTIDGFFLPVYKKK